MSHEIAGLPDRIARVPDDPGDWFAWYPKALAFRAQMQSRARADAGAQSEMLSACAHDPLYEFLVTGCVFEPRPRMLADGTLRDSGWYPWIPYAFQVELVRTIQAALAAHPGTPAARLGRGDLIVEKSRGMSGSWTFVGVFVNLWRWAEGFVGGMISYKQELVDEIDATDSLFYKARAAIGLNEFVPDFREMRVGTGSLKIPIRPPECMVPRHVTDKLLLLTNPERSNSLKGYSTTNLTTTGGRATALLLDEMAKFIQARVVWNSSSAVTDHRLGNSSADTEHGTGFRDLARAAEQAQRTGTNGPTFIRLRPDRHPERDSVWREEIEARHSTDPFAQQMLAREYDLDYEAGHGAHIYPTAQRIQPKPLDFHPGKQSLDFCVDPGIRDMTAFHLVSYDEAAHRYGLLASYANSGKPADFYASLVCASPLGAYDYGDEEYRIMEWFDRWGRNVRFWIGDPAGKARGGGQATSFYEDFRKATTALTDGRKSIAIWSSDKKEYRYLAPRIAAMRWGLELLDVNDNPDTIRTLDAIRDHRFRAIPEGRETTNPMGETVRTWGHDRVTALEFYFANRKVGASANATKPVEPVRVKLGGKIWKPRNKNPANPWAWKG